ncbi:putative disease resistance protein RGA3 isoform X2 [Corylus avellana]|uniref:putative disease resistance protein RGA3 isoform X2 n=1 Tax=Corylus avellana TaxID=13451 RepID=UPI00286B69FC|nr:putative disease resistance protein RGA3 isoform X2 [Corylus avellana]
MAELAFGIIGNVIQKLGSVAYQEFTLSSGFKSDLKKLKRTMSIIREVLLDAEKKQASDRLLRIWLGQLNNVLHDAEDVLDEIEYQALREQVVATYGSTSTKVRHFFSSSITRAFPFKLAHKIKGIRERLDEIAAEKDQFNLTIMRGDAHIMHRMRDPTHSFVHASTVIGRDEDKENIINLLMHPDCSKNVNVISVVGLGGLGKTTVAKWVYNDERVVGLFQLRMWVCVSEDFSLERLIKEILKSARCTIDPDWSVDTLQTVLRQQLRDKKFLLVLDDVWNEDRNKWIELRDLLIGASEGSEIIVTTRGNLVAFAMSTDSTYSLKGLSQHDCLSLFVKCAFTEGEEKQHPNLLKIGKEIVEKCKGVPLAVRTLGSLLYSKVDEREWEFVRDNEIWKLEQKESDILPALKLSYDQLPIHLKRCFAFCSLFPKDYRIGSFPLIHLWMANGLLCEMTSDKKQDLEDVGHSYIKELLSRSFFQDYEEETIGFPFYSFIMHDLIHDLAILVAQGECSVVDSDNNDIAGIVHHLAFSKIGQEVPKCLDKLTNVRTVMTTIDFQTLPLSLAEACILRFKCLRFLDLSDSSFEVLPSSIGTLKHLRYLDLSGNERIKLLPNSICKLHNLQTLILVECCELERLPKDIRNLINLISFAVTIKDTCFWEKRSLNSLRFFAVTNCPRLEVLFQGMDQYLTNVRTLAIKDCESLTSLSHSIKHLTALESLLINKCPKLSLMGGEKDNQDLKLSLRTLVISDLPKLEILPQWLRGSANTLQFLRIEDCENFTALPDWLPTLKSLHALEIIKCPKLSSLPVGTQLLTALRKLKIEDCPELSRRCKLEDYPKIARVPKVELDGDRILQHKKMTRG